MSGGHCEGDPEMLLWLFERLQLGSKRRWDGMFYGHWGTMVECGAGKNKTKAHFRKSLCVLG